ncbi:M50 family metallopeptidase [Tessaracoccus sp.]
MRDRMSILEDLWWRASATTAVPDASVLLWIALAALACVILAWPAVRMAVTVCHEAGHAVAATLSGRSLQGIRLHSDTSGVTLTRGKPTGAGMVFTLLSGYPAASLVGLLAAAVAGTGHAVGMLWLLVALLALMLLKIRNVYGALVVVALGAVLAFATWYAPAHFLAWLAYGLAWLLLLAGPRPVLELALSRAGSTAGSDAAQLARLTRLPRMLWIALWLTGTVGALVLGTALMLPGLLSGLLSGIS